MVSLPFLIALLTLIDITRSFEYFIDTKRCNKNDRDEYEFICYIRKSCLETSTAPADKNLFVGLIYEKLKGDSCDVIVQIKAFTDYKFHIMMQVDVTASDSPSDELDTTAGVSIVQDEPLIKCSTSGVEEPGVLKVAPYGTRQVNEKKLIFCSAIVDSGAKGTTKILELFDKVPYSNHHPSIQFTIKNLPEQTFNLADEGNQLWKGVISRCDDEKIFTANTTLGDLLAFEIDKAPAELSCPNHPQVALPLRIRVNNNGVSSWPADLFCKGGKWKFTDGGVQHVASPDFKVYCAIEFDKLCTPLQSKCPGGDCIPPQISPTTVSCPENKWRLADGSVMDSTVICKQRKSERSSGWFTNDGKEITEGGCSSVFHCPTFSKLNLSLPIADTYHREVDRSAGDKDFSCPVGFDLTVSLNGGTPRGATKLSCDPVIGLYKIDGGSDTVARGSSLVCSKPPPPPPPTTPAPISQGQVMSYVSYGLGAAFVLAAIGAIVFVVLLKKKRRERALKARYPDGMMTAREITDDEYVLKAEKWMLQPLTKSMRERRAVRERMMEPERKCAPYNVCERVTEYNSEIMPREGEFKYWRMASFQADILPVMHRYSTENRLKYLRALTAFMHYTDTHKERETQQFGMVDQFFITIKRCHQNKLKCFETWDSIFRLMKIFIEQLPKENIHEIPLRLRNVMKQIAGEIMWDVGYKEKPNESENTQGLRLVATRALLWAKDQKCMEELGKMAKLPLDQIESPIRMVVFSYAINNVPGKEQEIKDEFYATTKLSEKEPAKGVVHGTYRQHLLYALCSAKDTSDGSGLMGSFSTLREMFELLYQNKQGIFTPTDMFYAYKGALEDSKSLITTVDQFMTFTPMKCDGEKAEAIVAEMKKKFEFCLRTRAFDDEERKLMTLRHKADMIAMVTLIAESLYNDNQFKAVQPYWHFIVSFAVKPDSEVFSETFDEDKLFQRAHNLQFLFGMELLCFELAKTLSSTGYNAKEFA